MTVLNFDETLVLIMEIECYYNSRFQIRPVLSFFITTKALVLCVFLSPREIVKILVINFIYKECIVVIVLIELYRAMFSTILNR